MNQSYPLENQRQVSQHNIRNSIVRKISSLINMSKATLTQSLLSQQSTQNILTKKKSQQKPKQQKNRESARLARQRKKLYVSLLKTHVAHLQRKIKKGKSIQLQVEGYLRNLNQLADNTYGPNQEIQRYFSSSDAPEASSVGEKMDIILNEIYNLLMTSLNTVKNGMNHLSRSSPSHPQTHSQQIPHTSLPQTINPTSLHHTLKDPNPINKIRLNNVASKIQEEINSLNTLFVIAKQKNQEIKKLIIHPQNNISQQFAQKNNNIHLGMQDIENKLYEQKQQSTINTNTQKNEFDQMNILRQSLAVYIMNQPFISLINVNEGDGVITRAESFLSTND